MPKTSVIKLADGQDYIIGVFNVGDLIEIEKKYGKMELAPDKIEPIVFWLWLAIRKNHKEMTQEKLYDLIDAPFISNGGLANLFGALSQLNGWTSSQEKNA